MSATTESPKVGLDALRLLTPWPEYPPDVDLDMTGFFTSQHQEFLHPYLAGVKIILELGTWLGRSARWFLHTCPGAQLIAIDHWKGSAEHQRNPATARKLPQLWDTFVRTNWVFRDRLIPVRYDTLDGMRLVASVRVPVDLVYVDATHEPMERVLADIETAAALWPAAQITGDDWPHAPVREAVQAFAAASKKRIRQKYRCWALVP